MTIETLNFISNFYQENKDDIISIYETGSNLLDFIENTRDQDIVIITTDEDSAARLKAKIKNITQNGTKVINFNLSKLDVTIRSKAEQDSIGRDFFPMWLYQLHYLNHSAPLYGERLTFIELLEDVNLDLYKQALVGQKRYYDFISSQKITQPVVKSYYHLIIIALILKHKNYDFTENEKQLIIKSHDWQLYKEDIDKFFEENAPWII